MLFFGKILAFAGMTEKKETTWFPSYGVEMRGGTANCTVIISDEMIGSPIVRNPDILVTMNRPSYDKFQPGLIKKGILFLDSSLVKKPDFRRDIETVHVPATEIAGSSGSTRSANMVMLGALIARTGILKKTSILEILKKHPDARKIGNAKIN
ncbi:MAG: 2-oxoacid:acceptor oxidoreductase family protein, partial [Nitrospirota bacterium]|nr:2-oxoacid:acceptor oxidoreductase family protein [Nitrospirota bacterium]